MTYFDTCLYVFAFFLVPFGPQVLSRTLDRVEDMNLGSRDHRTFQHMMACHGICHGIAKQMLAIRNSSMVDSSRGHRTFQCCALVFCRHKQILHSIARSSPATMIIC